MVYIYTLSDPLTGEVRYVGKSVNPKKRFSNHISCKANRYTCNWIKSLRTTGKLPKLEIIEECEDSTWQECETYWIAQLKAWGFNLTNHKDGGGGSTVTTRSTTPWNKGKATSIETRQKMSVAHKLRDHSYKRGRKQAPEIIQKRVAQCRGILSSGCKFTPNDLERVRDRIHSGESPNRICKDFKVSAKTIYRIKRGESYKV